MTNLDKINEAIEALQNANSIVEDTKYTFCENCEENIYSHYIEDYDIMSYWSSWKVGK